MVVDQGSLFVAAGICSGALALTMLSVWLNNRADRFLLGWMIGMALLGCGVILYVMAPHEQKVLTAVAFTMQALGFIVVLAASRMFTGASLRARSLAAGAVVTLLLVVPPILLGFDGFGIMIYNYIAGGLLLATAAQYWDARSEAPCSIAAMTALYGLAALSFFACGSVLLHQGNWSLAARPDNWAEQFNAIMCIAGITGIGALSLGLNHARAASRHRMEARTDALTGLLNRRALFETLSGKILDPGNAVVAFDLDRFKAVNDDYGHAVGDEVLRRFADAVSRNVRHDDLAARTGGEEFVVVLRDASLQHATVMAERIRAIFAASAIDTPKGRLLSTASAGVALVKGAGESFEAVLHRADTSLYRAKDGGRDRVVAELQAVA